MARKLIKKERLPFSLRKTWGKTFIFFGFLSLGFFPLLPPAAAPAGFETPAWRQNGEMDEAWFAHREHLKKGNLEKSRAELEKIYQWKLDRGIRNHYPFALALIRESGEGLPGGRAGSAELLDFAEKMAPDLSQVPSARATLIFSGIPESLEAAGRGIIDLGQGIILAYSNPEEALPRLSNIALWILVSFLLTLVLFSLSLLVRYHSFWTHHLTHLGSSHMGSAPFGVLSLLILFSPFFLGLGWIWTAALWLLLFWNYGRRADRTVILTLLFLLLLLPTGIRTYASLLGSLQGKGMSEILRAHNGNWNEETYQKTVSLLRRNPEDLELIGAAGLMEKRMGRFAEAEEHFGQMLRLDPRSGAAWNNLGNVYLATQRLDQAVEAYQKAAVLEPSRGEPHYNLAQAYLLRLRMKEAGAELERAQTLQGKLISYYAKTSSRNPNRLLIDRTIDPLRVWQRALTPSADDEEAARGLWGMIWGNLPLERGEMAAAALLVLVGMFHLAGKRLSLIRPCERCGNLICSRCARSRVMGNQCVQCLNAFAAKPSLDPKAIKKKLADVARHQSRLASFPTRISLLLPGWGHLVRGRSAGGTLILFLFIIFVTLLFWGKFPNPWVPETGMSIPRTVLGILLFAGFYGLVQHRMKKICLQEGRSHFRRA